ncbi:uracil-DNA glycosylase family protein [Salinimonas iocasae]|uniref:Uracil-DNA glycosylase-like domain-containing protein n=1 Tax=Salinimonas iocasae TaxID=2572577 RepID=A0A5B7YFI8_9ALTE|nr:hypothetical protein [Salinimonas iocasae]QCZ94375.1 hypothetical protein FBQ74_13255 [Salinimonas iocasae]
MDNNQLKNHIEALRNYSNGSPFIDELRIESRGEIDVYFSPFEHINKHAKVVLVGISPGATQANNANVEASALIKSGERIDTISEKAKQTGAFSGALRNNLVRLLDYVGISRELGIDTCGTLFTKNNHLLHSTSVFRYPTLQAGTPISSAKKGLSDPLLKQMIDHCLADEVRQLPESAFYLPMGQGVDKILLSLCERGLLNRSQLLIGLPHPSGANAERIAYFLGEKPRDKLSGKTNADTIDVAKQLLLSQLNHKNSNLSSESLKRYVGAEQRSTSTKTARMGEPVQQATNNKSQSVSTKSSGSLVSPSDGFMLDDVERQIREQVAQLNLIVAPSKSRTSKELSILRGDNTVAYISREAGLKKGILVVKLHPSMRSKLDSMASEMGGVSISPGTGSRYISSSNYRGFDSRGYSSQLTSNQHQAVAYKVDVSGGFYPLKALLQAC